ncbi:MAG: TauD/TfdA family dioxygenase, partial [Gammaproteobacteria bacterium]|nr:TauD/TfdA family dioxygenase [Gammaproteobacteria bacterium]
MQIVPLDAGLGAEVREVDLDKPISAAMFEALRAAWQTHLVLVFRDQRLTDPALIRFAEGFGTIEPPGPNPYGGPLHKTHPELNVISNIKEAGKPIGNLGDGEAVWHADMTYTDVPPLGAILYAIELPAVGGDTHFANMYRAYEALPAALKEQLSSLRAIHDASHNSAGILRRGYEPVTDVTKTPGAVHPLVRTNAATGKRCLFLGRRPRSYVPGL